MIKIQDGIREKFYGIRDFTATQEAGFAKLGHTMHDWEKNHFRESNDESSPGGLLGLIFAGYVPLASRNPYPTIIYSVAIL